MKEIIDHLSHREKLLLYVLACFLIIVCGWFFVVAPSIDSYNKACSQYDAAISQKSEVEKTLQTYISAPESLAIKKESYSQIVGKYNPILKNEKVDKLITTAILSQGLKPISLAISTSAENATEGTTADATTTTDLSNDSIKKVTVNVTLNGSFTKITNLISYLNNLKGVSISKIDYKESTSPTESKTGSNVSMTIVVYMINK